MQPDFWLERWERDETGFHQEEYHPQLQRFWPRLELAPGATVFVPLCGKTRDMLWLREQGHSVLGVEVSPVAVQAFFDENGLPSKRRPNGAFESCSAEKIEILCGDFFELEPEQLADVSGVYDRASLVALPPSMRERYAAHLKNILPPSAQILLVTMDYSQDEMDGPPFSVSEAEVKQLYEDRFTASTFHAQDILGENPRFKERGLTRLEERVYHLRPR